MIIIIIFIFNQATSTAEAKLCVCIFETKYLPLLSSFYLNWFVIKDLLFPSHVVYFTKCDLTAVAPGSALCPENRNLFVGHVEGLILDHKSFTCTFTLAPPSKDIFNPTH